MEIVVVAGHPCTERREEYYSTVIETPELGRRDGARVGWQDRVDGRPRTDYGSAQTGFRNT